MQNNIWIFIQNNAPSIATLFFFLFFCSAVYSVFKKGQDKKFDDYAKIPLNDKEKAKEDPKQKNKILNLKIKNGFNSNQIN